MYTRLHNWLTGWGHCANCCTTLSPVSSKVDLARLVLVSQRTDLVTGLSEDDLTLTF